MSFSRRLILQALLVSTVSLAATLPICSAQLSDPYALWILDDTSRLYSIDPLTLVPSGTVVNLATTSTTEPARCMTQSTVADRAVQLFVGQGPLLRLVDVGSQTAASPRINLGSELGLSGLTIRVCDASVTREFLTATGKDERSFLFLGGTWATGQAVWIVVDQERAMDGETTVVESWGAFPLGAGLLDVEALETPDGADHLRALYTYGDQVGGMQRITTLPLNLTNTLGDAPALGPGRRIDLPTFGLPQNGLGLGAAFDRAFQVQPGWLDGSLQNFDTGFSCSFPLLFSHVSVIGAGPNSYSLFAAAPYSDTVAIVDPNTCLMQTVAVGDSPTVIVPRGRYYGDGLFVANEASKTLGFIDPNLAYRPIHLAFAGEPIAMGMIQQPSCTINNLLLDRVSTGGDQIPDDIELNWLPQGCPQGKEVFVWCACSGFPGECPCDCDCSSPQVDPDCNCPLVPMPNARGIGDVLVDFPPGDLPSLNPWKKLENTPSNLFNHENVPPGGTWFYLVTDSDDPPLP